jgi:hypothetical protein
VRGLTVAAESVFGAKLCYCPRMGTNQPKSSRTQPRVPDAELCAKWMPRARATCGRKTLHKGECRTAAALADSRQRKTDRRLGTRGADAPATRQRWHKAHRLRRYNITQHQLDRLLEAQEFACGMCLEPFGENRAIFIDHDHACCQEEKRSCGRCIRGLLCLDCNTTLGKIERKLHLAQAYLASPPAQLALAGGVAA